MTQNTRTKNSRTSRARSLAKDLQGLKLLGHVVTWSAVGAPHSDVVKALNDAGLDTDTIRELLPRHAFARACRVLGEERLIDVLRDEGDVIAFQFTGKRLVSSSDGDGEWQYDKEAVLHLNKDTGQVSCDDARLGKLAQAEIERCMEHRTANDITKVVQRLMDRHADLFPVREQGGVYFVPQEHTAYLEQVDDFLTAVGGRMMRFPVPAGTQVGETACQDAVSSALSRLIDDHKSAIMAFTINTRRDSIDSAADRVQATRTKIEAYAHYLGEQQKSLLGAVEEAKQLLAEKINEIAKVRASMPPEQLNGRMMLFGWAVTAVIRWMAQQRWAFKEVKHVIQEHYGVPVADATIRTQLQVGKRADSKPAELTADQVAELNAALGDYRTALVPKPVETETVETETVESKPAAKRPAAKRPAKKPAKKRARKTAKTAAK